MDLNGDDITPSTNVVDFVGNEGHREAETIIGKEQAKRYRLKNIFPDWRPEKVCKRLETEALKLRRQQLNVNN
jgi:hypothetical protein